MKPWRDPWVWLAASIIGLALAGSLAAFLFFGNPPPPEPFTGPAALTVLPAPTATATPRGAATLAARPTPTPIAPPPPPNGSITLGAFIQIRGTGGDGLRLRSEPSLKGTILALAKENEIFQVVEGPHIADGYTWWRLISPKDPHRGGWTVANYLSLLPTPPAPTPTP